MRRVLLALLSLASVASCLRQESNAFQDAVKAAVGGGKLSITVSELLGQKTQQVCVRDTNGGLANSEVEAMFLRDVRSVFSDFTTDPYVYVGVLQNGDEHFQVERIHRQQVGIRFDNPPRSACFGPNYKITLHRDPKDQAHVALN